MQMVARSSGCGGTVIVKDAPCSGVRKVKGGVELQRGEHRGEYSLERWSAQLGIFRGLMTVILCCCGTFDQAQGSSPAVKQRQSMTEQH